MKKSPLFAAILSATLTCAFASNVMAGGQENVKFLNSKPSNPKLPFSEAVKVGNTLMMSGQIGINPATGKLAKGGVKAEADQILKNIKKTLNKYDYEMNDVVKCLVILVDINDFKAFNEVYSSHFKPPYPARSAFAASALALNSQVEIECIAAK